jgi:hypothetical protein
MRKRLRKLIRPYDEALHGIQQSVDKIGRTVAKLDSKLAALQSKVARIESLSLQSGNSIKQFDNSMKNEIRKLNNQFQKIARNEFRQTEALGSLLTLMKPRVPLPATRGWAGSPDFLLHIYRHIISHRTDVVIELGSGVTTVVAAAALRARGGRGRLHCIDHDSTYAEATRHLIAEHGLEDVATVHHGPLVAWTPSRDSSLGKSWSWYSVPDQVNAISEIDLLVVDGPPHSTGRYARYPAVPQFRSKFTPGCVVLLDDAKRDDEEEIATVWSEEWGLTLELKLDYEKGLAVLTPACDAGERRELTSTLQR